jgi:hypothetical protein
VAPFLRAIYGLAKNNFHASNKKLACSNKISILSYAECAVHTEQRILCFRSHHSASIYAMVDQKDN